VLSVSPSDSGRRSDDVERASVKALEVGDVIDRLATKSDGTRLNGPPSGPDDGKPTAECVAHLLDELERVVRTVDAIRLAGLG